MIIVFILLIIIFVVPFLIYKRKVDDIDLNCDVNPYNRPFMKGEGFVVVDNILDEICRQKLIDTFLNKAKKNNFTVSPDVNDPCKVPDVFKDVLLAISKSFGIKSTLL